MIMIKYSEHLDPKQQTLIWLTPDPKSTFRFSHTTVEEKFWNIWIDAPGVEKTDIAITYRQKTDILDIQINQMKDRPYPTHYTACNLSSGPEFNLEQAEWVYTNGLICLKIPVKQSISKTIPASN